MLRNPWLTFAAEEEEEECECDFSDSGDDIVYFPNNLSQNVPRIHAPLYKKKRLINPIRVETIHTSLSSNCMFDERGKSAISNFLPEE